MDKNVLLYIPSAIITTGILRESIKDLSILK